MDYGSGESTKEKMRPTGAWRG